ncbi:bolA-like protein 3 [Diabrotica virgifera virgifera]|uniref:BolA-like protein 3 n=1 Tax=Diabrotica virgifera virgifera TaxID=50390 RepID=A0ABM5ITG8_DIAVI|nr:bolA-like protein 3 [Diabrotica virgifera virgifera]
MLKLIQSFTRYRQILPMQRINCVQANSSFSTAQEPVNEQKILEKLRGRFPNASSIHVEDTSGGCGAMFNVAIETSEFKGLSIPKQHKVVYDALKEEISKIHGLHLQTRVSD